MTAHRFFSLLALSSPLFVASAGCSEAVPAASEGAFSLQFVNAPSPGKECNIDTHNSNVGYTDVTENREFVKDTIDGATIYCAVTPEGDGFLAGGFMTHNGRHLEFTIPKITAKATEASPATGSVGYSSPQTINKYQSPPGVPCKFWFENDQQISTGRIWMQFRCEEVEYPSANRSCQVSGGTIAMQNCDQ